MVLGFSVMVRLQLFSGLTSLKLRFPIIVVLSKVLIKCFSLRNSFPNVVDSNEYFCAKASGSSQNSIFVCQNHQCPRCGNHRATEKANLFFNWLCHCQQFCHAGSTEGQKQTPVHFVAESNLNSFNEQPLEAEEWLWQFFCWFSETRIWNIADRKLMQCQRACGNIRRD